MQMGCVMKIASIDSDINVFSVRGEPELGNELQAITEMAVGDIDSNVIINFVGVDIIRSSSLSKLLELRQALIARGRQLVLCNINSLSQSIMEITNLNSVFTIVVDKEAAIEVIRSSSHATVL
jgi:anti-anti-sigma factor